VEGGGFVVRRPFPIAGLPLVDPFLLLDHMGPVDYAPGKAVGAPDHPHRGFETVSYILEGGVEHEDSAGHRGSLGAGDVQWMTAGRGVVHSELPSRELREKGGRMHGFQIWVNLPRAEKMRAPRYQDVASADIPVATSEDGRVRVKVVAGRSLGASAVIDTVIPITYLHVTLKDGGRLEQPITRGENAIAYVFGGSARVGDRVLRESDMAMFADDGEGIVLEGARDAEVLILAGKPLNEPVARYGPFVMTTEREIMEALEDFRAGRMGAIR
jgi:redox-sensitive bicupin YhaK (pirin superfamily)